MSETVISVVEVTRRFGQTTALDTISIDVREGEVFGLIGPDGAGKTTLIRTIATLLVPDGGRATVLGMDVVRDLWRIRPRLGYMPGRFSLYPDLSVAENLHFFAAVFGTSVEREYDRIAPVYAQLEPFRDRRAGDLSGGMKQKLALCCALVHRPAVLLLDEPTTGVDAVSRREFWDLLAALRGPGLTVLVSTPYMDEADRCDRVALMQSGRVLMSDTPARITDSFPRPLVSVSAPDRYATLLAVRGFEHARSVFPFGEALHYTDRRPEADAEQIASDLSRYLTREGIKDAVVRPADATIEDTFMELLG